MNLQSLKGDLLLDRQTTACLGRPNHYHNVLGAIVLAVMSLAPAWAGPTEPDLSGSTVIHLNKLPTCKRCLEWSKYLEANGFRVEASDVHDLTPFRERFKITAEHASCHTATVGEYVLEGHISAEEVRRLLTEKPAIAGLVIAGMPKGAPGMEGSDSEPYEVLALQTDGTTKLFATHPKSTAPGTQMEAPAEVSAPNARINQFEAGQLNPSAEGTD